MRGDRLESAALKETGRLPRSCATESSVSNKMFMDPITPCLMSMALALTIAKPACAAEQAPPGALDKIRAGLPGEPFAKPQKPRRLLVFSKTNGFRHASIATGKICLTEMGVKTGAFETVISEDLDVFEVDSRRLQSGNQ
jgi:hypothetical protein